MAEGVWDNAKVQAVYHPHGRRDNGSRRFRRANFHVILWQAPGASSKDNYIVPGGVGGLVGADVVLNDESVGHEFGYFDLEPIVIDYNQADGSDNLLGLHGFGYV